MEESIEKIEQRITNLEVAIYAIWALLKRNLPETYAACEVDRMMKEHFHITSNLGGFRRSHIDIVG